MRQLLWVLSLVVAVPVLAAVDGHWRGSIATPGTALEINVDLADGATTGDISIPVQGLTDRALVDVSYDGETVSFGIAEIPGDPRFSGELTADGATINGRFSQGGAELSFTLTRASTPADAGRAALGDLGAEIAGALEAMDVPGLGVAVVYDNAVIYAEGIGMRDVDAGLAMTPDTLFAIGSTTKAMTTTILGMLVDEERLDYDASVRTYIPEFELKDAAITDRMTVRDLVTHRSGLPRHDTLWFLGGFSREELLGRLAYLDFSAPHRQRWQYNNLMYLTAGIVMERVTGSSWEQNLGERLLGPLGMHRTNLSVVDSQRDRDHAKPYVELDGTVVEVPFRNLDVIGPAGSVNSSVNEMTRWLLFNLRGGEIEGERMITKATLDDIQSPHMAVVVDRGRPDIIDAGYGLGWWIQSYRGHRRLTHGGGIDGFTTSVEVFPNAGLGIVAFTNRNSGLPALVSSTIADRVLGLEPVDWIGDAVRRNAAVQAAAADARETLDDRRVAKTKPSHALDEYTGTFEHPGYGSIEISRDKKSLRLGYMSESEALEHWHFDVWRVVPDPSRVQVSAGLKLNFRSDMNGTIASLEAPLEPSVGPIEFIKQPPAYLTAPAFLANLEGSYASDTQRIAITLSGRRLQAAIPGQPVYTLLPTLGGRFALEGLENFEAGFSDDQQTMTVYQPNGVFVFQRVDD